MVGLLEQSMSLHDHLQDIWYGGRPLAVILLPLAITYSAFVQIRRWLYRVGVLRSVALPVPVILDHSARGEMVFSLVDVGFIKNHCGTS